MDVDTNKDTPAGATLRDIQDAFKIGYTEFKSSRAEAAEVWDLYHNRHYTTSQLAVLKQRGQPAETFNVVKMFARMLIGYYSTVVNTAVALPINPRDTNTASLINDIIDHVFEHNRMDIEGDQIKLGAMLSGLLACYSAVEDTGKRDNFNRPIYDINIRWVPDFELILDPLSRLDDYSDARWLHRFRWMPEEQVNKLFGEKTSEKLREYYNHVGAEGAEFSDQYKEPFIGKYKYHNNYLIVHTVIDSHDGRRWSVFWCDDVELRRDEITYREVRWPYRVQRLHSSTRAEYYGVFHEIIEAQKALNQAVLKIQLMVNSEKAFVETDAVENIAAFTTAFNRVNSVIPVKSLSGIKVEKLSKEVQDQYIIVDQCLDRIQKVLGINDSFLGMAFASDSGRKVKLQQNATIMSLHYITSRIEAFYASLGRDIGKLAQQFFYAERILRITDRVTGERWIALNQPMTYPDGRPILVEFMDPDTQEPMVTSDGELILAPVSSPDTRIDFTEFTIKVESNSYNDEDEKNQLLVETVMSGQIGNMLAQVNPAGFFKIAALTMRSTKTKYSQDIADVMESTVAMLNPQMQGMGGQLPPGVNPQATDPQMSATLKLPQNTNEEPI